MNRVTIALSTMDGVGMNHGSIAVLGAEEVGSFFSRRRRILARLGALSFVLAVAVVSMSFVSKSEAATAVGLGTADSYAVLGGSGVTNTGPSVINGNLGTSPTPSVTGFGGAPNGTVNGTIHQADAAAGSAKDDLTTAYNNAAGQGPATAHATELGGSNLTPGVYNSQDGTFGITGALTLNAQGNPNAVFIFKAASTLISASASSINLVNGAQACNVFWKVGSSATLGTSSKFVGNILALQSISLNNDVTVAGRLLARNGAVTLINDTVNRARCATGTGGGGGGGTGGGGGGGGTGGGGGGGTGGGGGAGGGGGSGTPAVHIPKVPNTENPPNSPRCVGSGFKAKIRVKSSQAMNWVKVYVDGNLIKTSERKRFAAWVNVRGLRRGKNEIRVVAATTGGERGSATRSFRRCSAAVASPEFTG